MADQTHTHGKRTTRIEAAAHPLDMLTADEISRGRAILVREGKLSASSRFPSVMPVEPAKDDVRGFEPGAAFDRRIEYVVLDIETCESIEYEVSLLDDAIVRETRVPSDTFPYGQPAYLWEEFERADRIAKESPEWQAAMRRRGLEDRMELAFCSPLAPGYFGYEDEIGRRMIRSLTFLRDHPDDSAWAHPVEGLLLTIDLARGVVVSVHDEGDVETASVSGRYDEDAVGPARTSLTPIVISQPEGPSFTVDGGRVEWEGFSFRVGFNAREGLVLNQLAFRDGDEERPILYRGSVPEMVVPYGDTSRNRYWISYFDAGEYYLGKNANSLSLGCDCLGVIHYFDATVAGDDGEPLTIPQAICMHEEDFSVLHKHTEFGYGPDVRRQRRLVISYFATVGNYDYGFYWHLYLDGTIEVEAKATGIVFNGSGEPGAIEPHRAEIAPGLFAPYHQHLFCARLDVEVDGPDNRVEEEEVVPIPMGDANPYGNAFTTKRTVIEREGGRLADNLRHRTWLVQSSTRRNVVGQPTGYQLISQGLPVLLADPESFVAKRAAFATKHTWVTRFEQGEQWPAGKYVNQHAGGAGLPAYAAGEDRVDSGDIVLWHTFGPTHVPRTEDWPIMPVDRYHFVLRPNGFFDRNPSLDVPDWTTRTAAGAGASAASGSGSQGGGSCCAPAEDASAATPAEGSCCGAKPAAAAPAAVDVEIAERPISGQPTPPAPAPRRFGAVSQ